MSATTIEQHLRAFLLALAAALALGIIVELLLTEHTNDPVQLIPFALCGGALAALIAVTFWPNHTTILVLRLVMVVVGLGSILGMVEHIQSNLEIVRETSPALAGLAQLWEAIHRGAPLLAPGALAVTAAVALAATYYHPALQPRSDT